MRYIYSLNINLPNEKGFAKDNKNHLSLAIDKAGVYYFNDQPATIDAIKSQLQANAVNNKDGSIDLQIDKEAEFSKVASILSLLQELQMNNVSFITNR